MIFRKKENRTKTFQLFTLSDNVPVITVMDKVKYLGHFSRSDFWMMMK